MWAAKHVFWVEVLASVHGQLGDVEARSWSSSSKMFGCERKER